MHQYASAQVFQIFSILDTKAGHILNSYVALITSSARVIEKTVNLADNEIELYCGFFIAQYFISI